MDFTRSKLAGALTAAALVLGGASAARAQEPAPAFEGMAAAGVAIPAGGLADVTSTGVAVGGGLIYRFQPHFAVRADVNADMLDGTSDSFGNQFPSMKLLHVTGGFQVDLPKPDWQDVPLTTSVDVGLGLTHMSTNESDVPAPVGGFSKTFFAATGALRLGWRFDPHVEAFAQGRTYLTMGKRGDLLVFTNHSPEVGFLRTLWSFPITAGLRLSF